ncbi:MAG: PaaI family thioesterase [Deltaproteobacteria bacterium]|nr:PaaI family thioesterase [Deltaproteobacteria bacterium]
MTKGEDPQRFRWRELLDAVTRGHDELDPHPGGPAIQNLDVPNIRSWEPGRVRADWEVPAGLTNLRGELFGGYFGVLADVVLSFVVMTVVEETERFKTNDLEISYFRPALLGTITFEAEVVNRSRSLVHAETRIVRKDGKLLAKANASFSIVRAS